MDDASIDPIFSLQFGDTFELREKHIHEAVEDVVTDLLLAVEPYREEQCKNANAINDHRFAETVCEVINPEEVPIPLDPSATPLFEPALEQRIPKTVAPCEAIPEDYVSWSNVPMVECVVCARKGEKYSTMKAPCGDTYCGGYANNLFERTADFEFQSSLKCRGQVIPLEDIGSYYLGVSTKSSRRSRRSLQRRIEPTAPISSVEPSFHQRQSMKIKPTALPANI